MIFSHTGRPDDGWRKPAVSGLPVEVPKIF
jgi:hypothetical protein